MLFTTHYFEEAEQFADRVVVLRGGQIVADGSVRAVRAGDGASHISFRTEAPLSTEQLQELPGVSGVDTDDTGYRLTTVDRDATLAALYQRFSGIRDVSMSSTSLEDVVIGLLEKED